MSKIHSISAIDLDTVTGGFSPEVQSFVDCANDKIGTFNRAQNAYASSTPWWARTAQAEDNFGTTLKEGLQGCIDNSPGVRRRPSGGF